MEYLIISRVLTWKDIQYLLSKFDVSSTSDKEFKYGTPKSGSVYIFSRSVYVDEQDKIDQLEWEVSRTKIGDSYKKTRYRQKGEGKKLDKIVYETLSFPSNPVIIQYIDSIESIVPNLDEMGELKKRKYVKDENIEFSDELEMDLKRIKSVEPLVINDNDITMNLEDSSERPLEYTLLKSSSINVNPDMTNMGDDQPGLKVITADINGFGDFSAIDPIITNGSNEPSIKIEPEETVITDGAFQMEQIDLISSPMLDAQAELSIDAKALVSVNIKIVNELPYTEVKNILEEAKEDVISELAPSNPKIGSIYIYRREADARPSYLVDGMLWKFKGDFLTPLEAPFFKKSVYIQDKHEYSTDPLLNLAKVIFEPVDPLRILLLIQYQYFTKVKADEMNDLGRGAVPNCTYMDTQIMPANNSEFGSDENYDESELLKDIGRIRDMEENIIEPEVTINFCPELDNSEMNEISTVEDEFFDFDDFSNIIFKSKLTWFHIEYMLSQIDSSYEQDGFKIQRDPIFSPRDGSLFIIEKSPDMDKVLNDNLKWRNCGKSLLPKEAPVYVKKSFRRVTKYPKKIINFWKTVFIPMDSNVKYAFVHYLGEDDLEESEMKDSFGGKYSRVRRDCNVITLKQNHYNESNNIVATESSYKIENPCLEYSTTEMTHLNYSSESDAPLLVPTKLTWPVIEDLVRKLNSNRFEERPNVRCSPIIGPKSGQLYIVEDTSDMDVILKDNLHWRNYGMKKLPKFNPLFIKKFYRRMDTTSKKVVFFSKNVFIPLDFNINYVFVHYIGNDDYDEPLCSKRMKQFRPRQCYNHKLNYNNRSNCTEIGMVYDYLKEKTPTITKEFDDGQESKSELAVSTKSSVGGEIAMNETIIEMEPLASDFTPILQSNDMKKEFVLNSYFASGNIILKNKLMACDIENFMEIINSKYCDGTLIIRREPIVSPKNGSVYIVEKNVNMDYILKDNFQWRNFGIKKLPLKNPEYQKKWYKRYSSTNQMTLNFMKVIFMPIDVNINYIFVHYFGEDDYEEPNHLHIRKPRILEPLTLWVEISIKEQQNYNDSGNGGGKILPWEEVDQILSQFDDALLPNVGEIIPRNGSVFVAKKTQRVLTNLKDSMKWIHSDVEKTSTYRKTTYTRRDGENGETLNFQKIVYVPSLEKQNYILIQYIGTDDYSEPEKIVEVKKMTKGNNYMSFDQGISTKRAWDLLNNVDELSVNNTPPLNPKNGFIYFFKKGLPTSKDYLADGISWKNSAVRYLPKKNPKIKRSYFTRFDRSNRTFFDFNKTVFEPMVGINIDYVLIQYFGKDDFDEPPIPHGNRKKDLELGFCRTPPSLIRKSEAGRPKYLKKRYTLLDTEIKQEPISLDTFECVTETVASQCHSMLNDERLKEKISEKLERNMVRKSKRNRSESKIAERKMGSDMQKCIADIYKACGECDDFVLYFSPIPNFTLVVGYRGLMNEVHRISKWNNSYCFSYDTAFKIDEFHISVFSVKELTEDGELIIPVAFMVHTSLDSYTHELFLMYVKLNCSLSNPVIITGRNPVVRNAIKERIPGARIITSWIGIFRDVEDWLRNSSIDDSDWERYKNSVETLLQCGTLVDFLEKCKEFSDWWNSSFTSYIEESVLHDIESHAGLWILKEIFDEEMEIEVNSLEVIKPFMKKLDKWKNLGVDSILIGLYLWCKSFCAELVSNRESKQSRNSRSMRSTPSRTSPVKSRISDQVMSLKEIVDIVKSKKKLAMSTPNCETSSPSTIKEDHES